MQHCAHYSDRGLDLVFAGTDASQIGEGDDEPDRPVPAHSQIADVVKEDNAGGTRGIHRFAQQGAHDDIRAPRLIHYRGAEVIVLPPETFQPLRHVAAAQVGPARYDYTCRLAAGVGINDSNSTRNHDIHHFKSTSKACLRREGGIILPEGKDLGQPR